MKKVISIFLLSLAFSIAFSQSESTDIDLTLKMSAEEYQYLKRIIKKDVVNWCDRTDDSLEMITMKMLVVQDTIIPVLIEMDTGNYEIDIISEFRRRVIGGFAGSYPFVESWNFNIPEEQLIEIIKEIKIENPELQIPGESSISSGRHAYWFFIEFYDKLNGEVISTWTRASTNSRSTLALISYHQHTNTEYVFGSETKLINRDFWKVENDNRISRFKTMIVDKIKEKIE